MERLKKLLSIIGKHGFQTLGVLFIGAFTIMWVAKKIDFETYGKAIGIIIPSLVALKQMSKTT